MNEYVHCMYCYNNHDDKGNTIPSKNEQQIVIKFLTIEMCETAIDLIVNIPPIPSQGKPTSDKNIDIMGLVYMYKCDYRPIPRDVTKRARRAVLAACFVEDKEAFLHVISHKRKMRQHALADIFKVLIF